MHLENNIYNNYPYHNSKNRPAFYYLRTLIFTQQEKKNGKLLWPKTTEKK